MALMSFHNSKHNAEAREMQLSYCIMQERISLQWIAAESAFSEINYKK